MSVAQADRPHSFSPVWKGKGPSFRSPSRQPGGRFSANSSRLPSQGCERLCPENLKHPWYLRGHRINPTLSLPLGMEEDHVSGHQVDSLEESISAYSSNLLSSGHQAQKHRSRLRLDQIAWKNDLQPNSSNPPSPGNLRREGPGMSTMPSKNLKTNLYSTPLPTN